MLPIRSAKLDLDLQYLNHLQIKRCGSARPVPAAAPKPVSLGPYIHLFSVVQPQPSLHHAINDPSTVYH
jgi:hypothetical protein